MTRQSQVVLGLGCMAFAVLVLGVWIPLDTESGIIETVRRRTAIGDAFAPTLAAVIVLCGGVLTALGKPPQDSDTAPPGALGFGARLLAVLVCGYLVALFAGPLAVAVFGMGQADPPEYRLLRATVPWKYIGFVLGGIVAISGAIAVTEGRMSGRALVVGIGAVLGMIVLFDLPFDDLLLPPNGDY